MEDARAVIEAAGSPVIGIGLSRGGNLLVHMAVKYPNRLEKLVTVGTSMSGDRPQARQAQEILRRDGIESCPSPKACPTLTMDARAHLTGSRRW